MQENCSTNQNNIKVPTFQDRDFEEVEGGYHDHNGNYLTPNGSFWDENLTYYNRDGFDKHGGTFDEYGTYIPGPEWNEDYNCYNSYITGGQVLINNHQNLQAALQENIKGELLDEYHYYQNFFKGEEMPENLHNLEVIQHEDFPLKEEYTYQAVNMNGPQISGTENFNTANVMRSANPTPNKKVDTVSVGKSADHFVQQN
jgi:hypothetical protein